MYFTKSVQKTKSGKKTKALLRALENVVFEGRPNMQVKLGQIPDEYKREVGTQGGSRWSLFHKPRPQEVQRPLSVYVLTDGVWQPRCGVKATIRNIVEDLQHHKHLNRKVEIQLIRFGNNEEGMERLAELDSKLHLSLFATCHPYLFPAHVGRILSHFTNISPF